MWLDCGNDLDHSFAGPWSEQPEAQLHPVISYKHMHGLNPDTLTTGGVIDTDPSHRFKVPQTATLLHRRFGQTLLRKDMGRDILYALDKVFSLAISSECQFLDMMEKKLDRTLEKVNADEFDTLPDLKFLRQLLYRHIQQIQETIVGVENARSPLVGPKGKTVSPAKEAEADTEVNQTATTTLRDLDHSLRHAEALERRIQDTISVLMSSVSIAESRRGMEQQERIGKLTILAFIFVPLSFTSFFGMNFKEMKADIMSIWQWFTVSVPIVVFTQLALFVTAEQMKSSLRWLRGRRKAGPIAPGDKAK